MISKLGSILSTFEHVFPRKAAYCWFVLTIFGFIVRLDQYGVSSMIRWLRVPGCLYESFLVFFRSSADRLDTIFKHWTENVVKKHAVFTSCGKYILMGDGIKISKESKHIPGVKKLHQDSNNSGKSEWIFGHHFGAIGLLAGKEGKQFCIPLHAEVHEGATALRKLQGKPAPIIDGSEKSTVVTLMAQSLANAATALDAPCVSALDAYHAAAETFKIAKQAKRKDGERLLHIVVRGKDSCVAYDPKPRPYCGKGRRPIYGQRYKLKTLFTTRQEDFLPLTVNIYGETKTVEYLCLDLKWKHFDDLLRFVLVKDGENQYILICSDLSMSPGEIISVYSKRFKIEVTFKTIKHVIGGFCYRFWTKAWEASRVKSLTTKDLKQMRPRDKRLIAEAMNAVEAFVNFAMIATGCLQILALEHAQVIIKKHNLWMRTAPSKVPSEEIVQKVIQHEFYHNFRKYKHTGIYAIIREKRQHIAKKIFRQAAKIAENF